MRGVNRAIIAGNLARDPDLRYTVNKRAYARFSVAVNYRYKDQNGEYKDGVDYIPVVVWGAQAENCGKYLKKGSPIIVEGRIQTGSYDAKDGSGKRYTTDILADNVVFLGSGSGSSDSGSYNSGASYGNAKTSYPPSISVPDDSDFGRSIGESGFGGGFSNDFDDRTTESHDESGIPF